jgi:hypothetical protein
MRDTRFGNIGLFNLVLFVGLYTTSVSAIPINAVASYEDKKYPIHVACECIFTLYVDGVYVGQGNKDNYDPRYGGESEWNDTKKYYPVISENEPKIIAFNGIGGQYTVFPNGFIMDMNDGKDYTKYNEWRCKDFSKTAEKTPPSNWFTYDYDDSGWNVSTSYGANYQNNSFQIFETPRYFITLNAEWLWTETNSDAVIYCRKKNTMTHTLPIPTTMPPPPTTTHPATTTAVPKPQTVETHTPVSSTTVPSTTAAPKPIENHTTASSTTHPSTTAVPKQVEKHTTASSTTHPSTTAVPKQVETHVEKKVYTTAPSTTHPATTTAVTKPVEKHTTVSPTTHPATTTAVTKPVETHVEKKVYTSVPPMTHPATTTAVPKQVEMHTTAPSTTHPATTTAVPKQDEKHTTVSPTTHPTTTTAVPKPVEKHTTVSPTTHPTTTTAAPKPVEKHKPKETHVEKKVYKTVPPMTHPATTAVPKPVETHKPKETHVEKKLHTTVPPMTHPATTAVPKPVETHKPKETHVEKKLHTTVPPTTHPTITSVMPKPVETHTPVSSTTHPATTAVPKPHPIETHKPRQTHVEKIVHTTVSPTAVSPNTYPSPTVIKNYNIVISPRIKIIINQIKRSHSRSNIHISSLLEKIKLYRDDLKLYKKILSIRLHLQQHYETIIRYILHQREHDLNEEPHNVKVPSFVKTLRKLNHLIMQIEHDIQFIKGNHKYILLNILEKLKSIYKKDTNKYLRYYMLDNMKKI